MIIGIRDVIRLCYEEEIDFIGFAVTIQQVNAIEAELLKQGKNYKKKLILIKAHPRTGRLLGKSNFCNLSDDILIYNFDDSTDKYDNWDRIGTYWYAFISTFIKRYVKNNRTIYIALPAVQIRWLSAIERNVQDTKVVYVILDDGGGSYVNRFSMIFRDFWYNRYNVKYLFCIMKKIGKMTVSNIFINKLFSNGRVIDNRLFKMIDGKFVRNTKITPYYNDLYKMISKNVDIDIINKFDNTVIINTQCLKENAITDGDADFDLYKKIVKLLLYRGVKVIIKTHPRELEPSKYEELGCDVYSDNQYSQESIVAASIIKPKCIVSIYSSTLLNINGIFGVPAISLAYIMRHEYKISNEFKAILDGYIEQYRSLVQMPKKIEDAVDMITCDYFRHR